MREVAISVLVLQSTTCGFQHWPTMGKLSKAQRRNARIERDVLSALKRRPPGPKRPMTRDWVIRLRDNAMAAHGGTKQQTLNLVDRVVKNCLHPRPQPRIHKCTVTGGRNLELAIATLVERDQPPAELLRSLRRVGVTKLSPRSAITLHAKALPRAIELRAQRESPNNNKSGSDYYGQSHRTTTNLDSERKETKCVAVGKLSTTYVEHGDFCSSSWHWHSACPW